MEFFGAMKERMDEAFRRRADSERNRFNLGQR